MTLDELIVKIGGDSSGFKTALSDAGGLLDGFGIDVGKITKFLTGPGGLMLAIAAVAKAAFDAGKVFDEASSTISKATGASGEGLAELNASFHELQLSGLEQDIGDVASAFGELNTRFGSTGELLKEQTRVFADFSDITGVDMKTAVADVSRLMNKWNIDSEDLTITLDQLAKAGQISGISVNELNTMLTNSATPLQNMGLSLTESVGLLSSFELAGVKSQNVMAGMNAATAKFADLGIDAAEGFQATVDAIMAAEDPAKATATAIEIFGVRAGPELANALRSGKMDLEAFTKTIGEAAGTVATTATASDTFGDKLATLGNILSASLAPIGEVLVDLAIQVMDIVIPILSAVGRIIADVFKFIRSKISDAIVVFKSFFDIISGIFSGDWEKVWNAVKRIVLVAVKSVLDTVSFLVNQVISVINGLLGSINSIITKVGLPALSELKRVTLADTLGINAAIADTYKTTETAIKSTFKELGKSGEDATLDLSEAVSALATLTEGKAAESAVVLEEEVVALGEKLVEETEITSEAIADMNEDAADSAKEAAVVTESIWSSALSKIADKWKGMAGIAEDAVAILASGFGSTLTDLGKALASGEDAWGSLGKSALKVLSDILKSLGDQLLALSVVELISKNFVGAALGVAGAAAAYISSGVISGLADKYASGTDFARGGLSWVGEQGPELMYVPRGAQITPAAESRDMSARGAGNTFIFNSPIALDAGQAARAMRAEMKALAFEGVVL